MKNSIQRKEYLDYIVYHRFIASKRDFIKSINGKTEQLVFVSPKKAFEKNIYHFHSYKEKTFSTFFTGLEFWDNQADYYQQGREAVKRLKEFIRVFLVETITDLEKPLLKEQIKLDFQAGIQIYLCMFADIKNLLPEPDFGTWDDKYLCVVPFGNDKKVKDIRISNRNEDLEKVKKWIKIILEKSIKVNHPTKDINEFIDKHKGNS